MEALLQVLMMPPCKGRPLYNCLKYVMACEKDGGGHWKAYRKFNCYKCWLMSLGWWMYIPCDKGGKDASSPPFTYDRLVLLLFMYLLHVSAIGFL